MAFFEEYYNKTIFCDYIILHVARTPRSHHKLEELAELLKNRLEERFRVRIKLIITEPFKVKVIAAPYCCYNWKYGPFERLVRTMKADKAGCLIILGQRASESTTRARLGKWGTFHGCMALRPVYKWSKIATWLKALDILPEAEKLWKLVSRVNNGHTSLDCVRCLRLLKK